MVTTNNAFNTLDLLDDYADGSGKDPFSIRYDLVDQIEIDHIITLSFEFFCRLDKVAFVVYGKPDWAEVLSVYNRRGAILLEEAPGSSVKLPTLQSLYKLFRDVGKEFER